MLKIWGRRSAFNVQKVLWAIGELDLEHEHVDAGGAAGGLDSPPELPNLKRWYLQLSERPAYREHVMLDFSALRGRLDF